MIDMRKWQDMAKANIHARPATSGRLAGKIAIVTGSTRGIVPRPLRSPLE